MNEKKKKSFFSRESINNTLKLYSFIKPYGLEYSAGLFFLLGSSLASLALPKLLGDLVNAGSQDTLKDNIGKIVLILAVLLVVQSLFSYFRTILFVNVTEKTLADLRQHTYNHLIKLPLAFYEKHRVGEMNSRISSDISLLQETLTTTLAEFIRQLIIIAGGITLLMITSFKLTLFMLAIIPAIVILAVIFGRYIRSLSKQMQKELAKSNTVVEETLQGIQSVKSYTNEFFEMARYKVKTTEIARLGMKSGRYRGAFVSFMILGMFGAMVAVIWKGATLLSAAEINAGDLFSFVIYTGFIAGTIGGLAGVFTQIQRYIGATEDLFEIFDEKEENITSSPDNPDSEFRISGKITFKHVSFAYPNRPDEKVLRDINFRILPDQMVALVGISGAGKTTITSLLMRLYDIPEGEILFDDTEIKQYPLSVLRSQISIVPQDIFLFGGTIRENIAYGKPGASDEEILEAAKKANASEFINRFPEGLDTIVGERGTQLSGGQRQRIAIARAILKDPRVLILDEATSSLDSESEQLVQDALENLMKNRTSVVIAHRLSTIRKADMILVLDKGCLVETGSHDELMALNKGVYKKLRKLQYS